MVRQRREPKAKSRKWAEWEQKKLPELAAQFFILELRYSIFLMVNEVRKEAVCELPLL